MFREVGITRIAVLSDIHGNLTALEAVIADAESQKPDQLWCGGDIGWGGPWTAECISTVRRSEWPTVKGNTDVWLTGDPQTIESEAERDEHRSFAVAHNVSDDDIQWLLNLPLGHTGPGSILLVHGTPDSPFTAPMPEDGPAEFSAYQGQAALVVFGHVHRAFTRRLTEGTLVTNPGSVGAPADGDDASYLIIDQDGPDLTLRHRRVGYDREGAIARAHDIGGRVAELFIQNIGG
jgi:putative phosphoesterase